MEEGADPRDAVLVAFGGAGGLHASRLARRLGMRTVLVPPFSGVFSALGLLLAAPRSDVARTVMAAEGTVDLGRLRDELAAEVSTGFEATFQGAPLEVRASADVRYVGQSHELEVPLEAGWVELRDAFEADHRQRFGFSREGEPIELVNVRSVAAGRAPLSWADLPAAGSGRPLHARGGIRRREALPAGSTLEGPALVVGSDSTVSLEAADQLTVLDDGSLEISL